MKDLSIVIVTYGQADMVCDCLRSIYNTNDIGDGLEVIISDNSPTNEVLEKVNREFPHVETIKNDNVGFGRGNNIGYSKASGKYVLFLNPDTIIIRPILKYAIKIFENNQNVGMFGVKLLSKKKKKLISYSLRQEYSLHSIFFINSYIKFCNFFNIFNSKKMYPFGAALFFRSSVFELIGRFDENIFMYYEEPDLCNRVEEAGYSIKYVPKIEIIHLVGKSSKLPLKQLQIRLASLKYYANKYNFNYKKTLKEEMKLLKFKNKLRKIANCDDVMRIYEEHIEGCAK